MAFTIILAHATIRECRADQDERRVHRCSAAMTTVARGDGASRYSSCYCYVVDGFVTRHHGLDKMRYHADMKMPWRRRAAFAARSEAE